MRPRFILAASLACLASAALIPHGGAAGQSSSPTAGAPPCSAAPLAGLQVVSSPAASARVDSILAPWAGASAPGAAVLVMRGGAVVHAKGYGLADLESRAPITPATALDIASVAKQFTAEAILMLAARGTLGLDDTLTRYFPEFPGWARRVTLRHLLGHISGIPDYEALWETSGRLKGDGTKPGGYEPTTEATAALLAGRPSLEFEPGARWTYSNTNYVLLALIVEKVASVPFPRFMREQLFEPLGMTSTRVGEEAAALAACRARSYTRAGRGYRNVDYHALNRIYGDGVQYTTLGDMARWELELERPTLLPDSVLGRAFASGTLGDGRASGYGFGWFVGKTAGLLTQWHAGYWNGFKSAILRYPEQRVAVVVLSNLEQFDPEAVAAAVADVYVGEAAAARVVAVPDATLREYAGRYVLNPKLAFTVTTEGGSLYLQGTGQPRLRLVATSPADFYAADLRQIGFTFGRAPDGRVATLTVHQRGDHVATRAP